MKRLKQTVLIVAALCATYLSVVSIDAQKAQIRVLELQEQALRKAAPFKTWRGMWRGKSENDATFGGATGDILGHSPTKKERIRNLAS